MFLFVIGALVSQASTPLPTLRWISPMDYPAALEREKPGGLVEAEFTYGDDGRMTACRVVASSGNAVLDRHTCSLSQRRGRARPGEPRVQLQKHLWVAPE